MARKAIKDTYATVIGGGGVEQRVRVFAGHVVPNSYQMEEGSYEEVEGGITSYGPPTEPPPDKPASEPEAEQAEAPAPSKSTRRKKASEADSSE
jgi:hypothetical protein